MKNPEDMTPEEREEAADTIRTESFEIIRRVLTHHINSLLHAEEAACRNVVADKLLSLMISSIIHGESGTPTIVHQNLSVISWMFADEEETEELREFMLSTSVGKKIAERVLSDQGECVEDDDEDDDEDVLPPADDVIRALMNAANDEGGHKA